MRSAPVYAPAPKETPVTVREFVDAHVGLCDLLAQEAKHMQAMHLGKVGELQDRKLKLTSLIERYMQYLKTHPQVMAAATLEEKSQLREAGERFRIVAKANYDTLLIARAVNQSVVKCVTQLVARRERNPVYNARGAVGVAKKAYPPISVTLNQTV